ncbi:MAG: hypothetical protein GY849_08610 [Deltaproteobacteria bacterium]|nr:hypothetical protein [Deltaproteobacteria bacterium]
MLPFSRLLRSLFTGLLFGFFMMAVSGCGYHFQGTGKPVGISMDSLAIPLMESTSSFMGFEGEFTRAIREEFVSHGRVPIVSREEASTVLIGKIYEIETEPYSYELLHEDVRGRETTYEVTNARWLEIVLKIRLEDRATGHVIWEDRKMTERHTYAVTDDPLANRFNQRRALRAIARTLARRIYAKTMERF